MNKMVDCKICFKKYKSHQALMRHISKHKLSSKKYYDLFFKNKSEGSCLECQKETKFKNSRKGYNKFCSLSCSAKYEHRNFSISQKKSRLKKIKKTMLERYGVENSLQSKEIRKKIEETNLKKYGERYPTAYGSNGFKKRMKEKYGTEKPFSYGTELFENLMISRYGKKNYFETKFLIEYNKKNKEKIQKKKEKTSLKRYGVKYYLQSENGKNNFHNKKEEMKKKYNRTCQKKYNTDWYVTAEPESKKKERYNKIWATKKRNGTTNSSKIEKKIYLFLKEKYLDVEYNYKSEKYPFSCDYYISKYKLYIELQGFWTHGYRAFLGTKSDYQTLKKWEEKAKNSTFYKNGIYVWSKLDVLKRETALKNNIRYLEIFDYNLLENINTQIRRVIYGLNCTYKDELFSHKNYLYKNNPIIRRKIIQSAFSNLKKQEHLLSDEEILKEFKRSNECLKELKISL